jgi:hypothetical protein
VCAEGGFYCSSGLNWVVKSAHFYRSLRAYSAKQSVLAHDSNQIASSLDLLAMTE